MAKMRMIRSDQCVNWTCVWLNGKKIEIFVRVRTCDQFSFCILETSFDHVHQIIHLSNWMRFCFFFYLNFFGISIFLFNFQSIPFDFHSYEPSVKRQMFDPTIFTWNDSKMEDLIIDTFFSSGKSSCICLRAFQCFHLNDSQWESQINRKEWKEHEFVSIESRKINFATGDKWIHNLLHHFWSFFFLYFSCMFR